jgi:hypothetical protein
MTTEGIAGLDRSATTDETHRATDPRAVEPRGYYADDRYDDNFQVGRP